jgi:hypothetical protein
MDFSDHHPILISPKEAPHPIAPRQFKFESAWLLEKTYNNMMKHSWNHGRSITENLSTVEQEIKSWKFHTIDHVLYKKKEIMARINGVQRRMQDGRNNGGLKRLEQKLQSDLNEILRKEELMWYQRSRAKWLTDGDRNTRYYHLKTVNRRKKNNITMLKDSNGNWVEDVDQISQLINDYYVKLFDENSMSREWFQTIISFSPLDLEMTNKIAAPINDKEVKNAVFKMSPWKAPGPDGFPAGFYQKSWEIVGDSVCNFVKEMWENPSGIADVNYTDICLIPKVTNPEHVHQFRPISLCNTIYKVVIVK